MKRFIILIGTILVFVLLYVSLSKPTLQLINSKVSIVNDKSKLGSTIITEGDKKGKELVTTTLYYEFTIKNVGNKSVGDIGNNKDLLIKIVPNKKLESTSKEVVGFNIFNPSSYTDTGVGYGYSSTSILKVGEEGRFINYYDLGVSEKNSQVLLMVPSEDKLKKLQENALDASLLVILEDKEIARFDLIKK